MTPRLLIRSRNSSGSVTLPPTQDSMHLLGWLVCSEEALLILVLKHGPPTAVLC